MALSPGTRFGPYEITGRLGVGGMGEVYRATDTSLKRDVAVKVLPAPFVYDPERLARFGREAQLLASLNHPNIASIYGLVDSGEAPALVMELVEGPTLADRIREGPVAIEEAVAIAKQITEALEYAHERGIVHRDLKPDNVKVAGDGTVKVLDFGLAKALETDGGAPSPVGSPDISHLATKVGTLLGTAAYMSPEQAKGRQVDRRADVWAFGCLLYEMLTGQPAFLGEVVTDTLAAVLRADPNWVLLPPATPEEVRILLRRCLQKDARRRLQSIGDARIAIEEVLSGSEHRGEAPQRRRASKLWVAWGAAGAIIAAIAGLGISGWISNEQPRPVIRFTIDLPPGQRLAGMSRPALAFSADGSQLAYVATTDDGIQQIYLRTMDELEARPISGTAGATNPFFSPDGQSLGFLANGNLQRISVKGGVAQTLAGSGGVPVSGASWINEHSIAFTTYQSVVQGVSDDGGMPTPLTRFEPGESSHLWPQPLPGGTAILFTGSSASLTSIAVQPISGGERRDLVNGQASQRPSYVPSGHLIFAQAGNLMAVPLDLERLAVRGAAVPVVQDVFQSSRESGTAQFSISASGSLAYVSGAGRNAGESRLVWVSRDGTERILGAPARFYNQPRVSPDGRRIAVDVVSGPEAMQVWLYDQTQDTMTPFTFEGLSRHATWTPDGRRIVFMSNREGATQLYWQPVDGSGGSERLTSNALTATADVLQIPYSWSRDGDLLIFTEVDPNKGADFWALDFATPASPEQDRVAQRLPVAARSPDGGPQLSPDGRWLAYASDDESGLRQVYLEAYPGPGAKRQISTDGGNEPLWNPDGQELFYRWGDEMMAVDISVEAGVTVGKPRRLFAGRYANTSAGWVRPNYDVSPDGQQFLMLKPTEQEEAPLTQINVVLNWFEELERRVPTD